MKKGSERLTISLNIDIGDIFREVSSEEIDEFEVSRYENFFFKKNPYIFRFEANVLEEANVSDKKEDEKMVLFRTYKLNYAALNGPTLLLLNHFDGESSLKSVYGTITGKKIKFLIDHIRSKENGWGFFTVNRETIVVDRQFKDIILLVKALFRAHLIELADYHHDK